MADMAKSVDPTDLDICHIASCMTESIFFLCR